ncbi:carbon storage regulator [Legionella longbeachae]|uniref:carbon storage regulator n=1 Tax=Legionella longbeachae TaxID=450 RepID=UPI000A1C1086|nr:carbon storage regulator [Legionella longbeachae]ARM33379.1 carbon storage regulator [Legionella longbeachae]
MLVLTRKVGESVVISENIYCTVVDYRHGEIRLAFDAPQTIPIHRDEIQRRIYLNRQQEGGYCDNKSSQESVVDRLINQFKHGVSPAQGYQ